MIKFSRSLKMPPALRSAWSIRNSRRLLLAWVAMSYFCASPIPAQEAQPADDESAAVVPDFAAEIWPLLVDRCHDCHAGEGAEALLRLDGRPYFDLGGVSGPLIDTTAEKSLLVRRLKGSDGEEVMPPDDPLTPEEIDLIERWIEAGAPWADGVGATIQPQMHWAYQPPVRPSLPREKNGQSQQNPLDHFIENRLREQGLDFSAEANPETLVRRLYLDLVGLPPTLEQLNRFLADRRPDRYERLVDRLLSDPAYGEHWAKHWLDLARYADSNGYQADQYREVWAYRDWVIDAMNGDMSFEEFTTQQIAGDLLPDATLSQRIATGFHRLTTCNVEAGVDPEQERVNQVVDRVNTTGTVWLGTTLECAQCHNHKYDPFSQQDYYSMFAYFNQTPIEVVDSGNMIQYEFIGPKLELQLTASQGRERDAYEAELSQLRSTRTQLVERLRASFPEWVDVTRRSLSEETRWQIVPVESFVSTGGADVVALDDGSFLVTGEKPGKDEYRLILDVQDIAQLGAIKIETLTHDSLPGRGPGRHEAERPNFVLNEFQATWVDADQAKMGDEQRSVLAFATATADFSQQGWPVSGSIDGDLKTGWGINPEFHKDHWAVYSLSRPQPIDATNGQRLELRLSQQYGGGRTIGRLRVSVSDHVLIDLPDKEREILQQEEAARSSQEQQQLFEFFLSQQDEITQLDDQMKKVTQRLDAVRPSTSLVMVQGAETRMTNVLRRGDFLSPGDEVEPSTPRVLPRLNSEQEPSRLDLARWLTSRENPLAARVFVNRWWAQIFGRGIVGTLDDFGSQGDLPTHPQLLDWLAVELQETGSMKHLLRLMVTSRTYKQSSSWSSQLLETDPENRWYARGPRFRLSAETIRDVALVASGSLDREVGGPPVYPPQPAGVWRHVGRNPPKYNTSNGGARYRRGLYVVWRRSAPYPSFVNFDAPDRASCVVSRAVTNTPLQALTLLNDPQFVELRERFAQRMVNEGQELTLEEQISRGFQIVLTRRPTGFELRFLQDEFVYAATSDESAVAVPMGRQAALAGWRCVAEILFNLDETITKE